MVVDVVPLNKSELQRDGTRLIREVKLFEISLVAGPADPNARVTSVKDVSRLLHSIRADAVQPSEKAVLDGGSRDAEQVAGRE